MSGRSSVHTCRDWATQFLLDDPPRAQSLMTTVWGDALAPRGGAIWLEHLIALMDHFGMSERLVRTTVFRMARDGWLSARREGRRSQYQLTAVGQVHVEHAHRRIYSAPTTHWDGQWTFLLLDEERLTKPLRHRLRRELSWEGYGLIAPGVYAHPSTETTRVYELLDTHHAREICAVFLARDIPGAKASEHGALAQRSWPLEQLASRYREFMARVAPLTAMVGVQQSAKDAFVTRTLVLHAYRRVLLYDPQLPTVLLSTDWPAVPAYELCRTIYQQCKSPAEQHLDAVLREPGSPSGETAAYFYDRFTTSAPAS